MKGYTQLTREQRYRMHVLLKTKQIQTQIAVVIEVHRATISPELRRNRGGRGYRPQPAHGLAQARLAVKHQSRLGPAI